MNLPQEILIKIISCLDLYEYIRITMALNLVHKFYFLSGLRMYSVCEIQEMLLRAVTENKSIITSIFLKDKRLGIEKLGQDMVYKAIINNAVEVLKVLLESKRVSLSDPENIAKIAGAFSSPEILKMVVHTCIRHKDHINIALELACLNDKYDNAKYLLSLPEANPCRREGVMLWKSCDYGNTSIVKLLLEDGRVDPNDPWGENGSLIRACHRGHYEIVEMLLQDPRVDPAAPNNENLAFCHAKFFGHPRIVERLIQEERVKNNMDIM